MAKAKTVFVCNACGYETPRWMGKCPDCGAWNTLEEEVRAPEAPSGAGKRSPLPVNFTAPQRLSQVETGEQIRTSTGIGELDRVLGGGAVAGSLVLVGGDPGIGKSTLLLQVSHNLANQGKTVLYITGEESPRQVKLRAERLGADAEKIYVLPETDITVLEAAIASMKPDYVVADSIQTLYDPNLTSAPGSVSQVKAVTSFFLRIAKGEGITVFLVGHVTKEGAIAGPRVLEHMVDTVLYFEGERHQLYRILRSVKNRFGSTNEIGVFEMVDTGMVEVKNPSAMMLSRHTRGASGSAVFCALEGTRPMLVEVQALVAKTAFPAPRRTVNGVDYNRAMLLMAVLEKKLLYPLNSQDVYINVAGGMRLTEPAADLAILAAIASSLKDQPLPDDTVFLGEVGLTGEIRGVPNGDKRVMECRKMGYNRIYLPHHHASQKVEGVELFSVRHVAQAFATIFKK
ncbi:DNA repair protein RadA [Gehongia tenuis]|uniref:DNA repair protein RadA n=1 Tax=Gehongia tenuis TaxID=2763655 RepID=A0A926D586_9FIRM|nr:DNA repair protein RadA [Gehongia tenuis]MBC8531968.1 DNA repair protein RadA [Gehongia tenuis]